MPSDVPDVMTTRSGETGIPRRSQSAATASRAAANADRGRIAILPASDRCFDGVDQVRRSLEAEDDGIADVEIPDLPSGCLNLLGLRHDIADCVDKAPNS